MIYLSGINLYADEVTELHEFCRKLGVSKGWFHLYPEPHYDIICPFNINKIINYLKKQKLWKN